MNTGSETCNRNCEIQNENWKLKLTKSYSNVNCTNSSMCLRHLSRRNLRNVTIFLKRSFLKTGSEGTFHPPKIKGNSSLVTPNKCKPLKCYQQCAPLFRGKSACGPSPYPPEKPPNCLSPTFPSARCLSQLTSKKCK